MRGLCCIHFFPDCIVPCIGCITRCNQLQLSEITRVDVPRGLSGTREYNMHWYGQDIVARGTLSYIQDLSVRSKRGSDVRNNDGRSPIFCRFRESGCGAVL